MLSLLFPLLALACSRPAPGNGPELTFAGSLGSYNAIFSTEPLVREGDVFRARVREALQGAVSGEVRVQRARSSCDPSLEEGVAYVLYATKEKDGSFHAASANSLDRSFGAIAWLRAQKAGVPEKDRDALMKKEDDAYEARREECAKLGAFPAGEPARTEAKKKWATCHVAKGLCAFLAKDEGRAECFAKLKGY